jgi:HSP20 family protein
MIARINKSYVPAYLDDIFNDQSFNSFFGSRNESTPGVNVVEDNIEFRIDVASPGLSKNDFNIDLNDDLITISAEKEAEQDESGSRYMRREFNYNSFKRKFQLPDSVDQDKISASHAEGILSVHLPKKEEEVSKGPKTIDIS